MRRVTVINTELHSGRVMHNHSHPGLLAPIINVMDNELQTYIFIDFLNDENHWFVPSINQSAFRHRLHINPPRRSTSATLNFEAFFKLRLTISLIRCGCYSLMLLPSTAVLSHHTYTRASPLVFLDTNKIRRFGDCSPEESEARSLSFDRNEKIIAEWYVRPYVRRIEESAFVPLATSVYKWHFASSSRDVTARLGAFDGSASNEVLR